VLYKTERPTFEERIREINQKAIERHGRLTLQQMLERRRV
jgi:hypothetical protein